MSMLIIQVTTTTTNALFYHLCLHSFTQLLHVSALLSSHLQGADNNITLKHTEIKKGHNKHTRVVAPVVQNLTRIGQNFVHKCSIILVQQ